MSSASGSNPQLAVFLSYAREDAAATRRLAEALRAGGLEVWFDENELRGGDAWDRAIRKQIRDCALFVPIVSANTQARLEGYFRLEWKLAEDRSHLMAKGKPFIVPVCIDDTPERDALVPDAFMAVQWSRLPGGAISPEVAERFQKLRAQRTGGAAPVRPRPSRTGGGSSAQAERRLAAVVFTDVVGYSARMQRDETGTMGLMAEDFARMRESSSDHGGEVLNTMGDGLLMCFPSAVQAVTCALQLQSEFSRRRSVLTPEQSLEHRMGVHIGDVFRQETGGIAGDGVNIAARLEGKAPVGGICVSQMVYDTVKGKVPMQAVFIGPESFKNITEPIPIWHLAPADALAPSRPATAARKPNIPDYELLRQIGRGSYGDVWLARGATGIWRAIKVVWRDRFADAEPFEREWRGLKEFAAISLGETSQMALLHVGRNDDAGFFYYVMELADDAERGRAIDPASYVPLTLTQLRARRSRLPADECVRYGTEIARVLAGLHRRGLLHRDIKPSNIILVNGVPKLADIGLVAPVSDASTFVGTEGFVPPDGPGSPSADVFALGKVLYELATGLDRQEFPQLPPELNRLPDRKLFFRLNEIILRACEPAAAKRYIDASALLADLARLGPGRSRSGARDEGGDFAADFAGGDYYRDRVMPWMKVIIPLAGMAMGMFFMFRNVWRPARRSEPKPPAAMPAAAPLATPPATPAPPITSDKSAPVGKSIVVLPLQNLSPDPADAFFTDGMHGEIITTLQRLGDLMVISRATAQTLKDTKESLPALGRKLGVAYALSGSVQRSGKSVRIALELRRTDGEELVWQKTFNVEFTDGFAVQDEVAAEVAKIMQIHTSTGWFAGARFMTKNVRAYDLFLKARDLQAVKGPSRPTFLEQVALGEQAMALDPNFMAGASMLSGAYVYLEGAAGLTAAERAESAAKAKHWAERAAELVPGGAGDGALSVYYSMVEGDHARGLIYAQNEVRALPNDPNGHNRMAVGLGRLGRYREALAAYNRALALDPFHARTLYNRVRCAAWLRDLPAFEEAAAKSLEFGGQNINRVEMHEFRFYLTGRLPDPVPRLPLDSPTGYAMMNWYARRFDEVLAEADRALAGAPPPGLRFRFLAYQARAAHMLARPDVVAAAAREMMTIVEKDAPAVGIEERQQQAMKMWALVFLERKTEALAIGRRLVEGLSAPAQTSLRWSREHELAQVHAWFGDKKECLEILTRLLKVPSGVMVPYLRLAPDWDRVRDDPGFQALLADPKNSAPL